MLLRSKTFLVFLRLTIFQCYNKLALWCPYSFPSDSFMKDNQDSIQRGKMNEFPLSCDFSHGYLFLSKRSSNGCNISLIFEGKNLPKSNRVSLGYKGRVGKAIPMPVRALISVETLHCISFPHARNESSDTTLLPRCR